MFIYYNLSSKYDWVVMTSSFYCQYVGILLKKVLYEENQSPLYTISAFLFQTEIPYNSPLLVMCWKGNQVKT